MTEKEMEQNLREAAEFLTQLANELKNGKRRVVVTSPVFQHLIKLPLDFGGGSMSELTAQAAARTCQHMVKPWGFITWIAECPETGEKFITGEFSKL
jgi:hypothetical protein